MRTIHIKLRKWTQAVDVADEVIAAVGNDPQTVARFLRLVRYSMGGYTKSVCFPFDGQHYRVLWRRKNAGPVVDLVDAARAKYWTPKGTRVTWTAEGQTWQGVSTGRYTFSTDRFDAYDQRYEVMVDGERRWVAEPREA